MSFSVNTNGGALIALQYLSATQSQLAVVQTQINSGLKVATARDDGAIFAIAQNQRGAVAGYTAVTDSFNRGIVRHRRRALRGSVDFGSSDPAQDQGACRVRRFARHRQPPGPEPGLHRASRPDRHDREERRVQRLQPGRRFDEADHGAGVRRRHTPHHDCRTEPFSVGTIVTITNTASISTQSKASTLVATIQASLTNVNSALAKLSSGAKKFSIQATFVAEAVGHVDRRHRQPGRREPGPGQRRVAVPAGQAAARRSGSVDRQPVAADHSVSVPLSLKTAGVTPRRSHRTRKGRKNRPFAPGRRENCWWAVVTKEAGDGRGAVACFLLSEFLKTNAGQAEAETPRTLRVGSGLSRIVELKRRKHQLAEDAATSRAMGEKAKRWRRGAIDLDAHARFVVAEFGPAFRHAEALR